MREQSYEFKNGTIVIPRRFPDDLDRLYSKQNSIYRFMHFSIFQIFEKLIKKILTINLKIVLWN